MVYKERISEKELQRKLNASGVWSIDKRCQ
jgi:hypothetical protein